MASPAVSLRLPGVSRQLADSGRGAERALQGPALDPGLLVNPTAALSDRRHRPDPGPGSAPHLSEGPRALANSGVRRRTRLESALWPACGPFLRIRPVSRPDCFRTALTPRYPVSAGPAMDRAIPTGGRARTTPADYGLRRRDLFRGAP